MDEKIVIEKVLLASIREQRANRRWKIFFRFIWLITIAIFAYFYFAKSDTVAIKKNSVALVKLDGEISQEKQTYKNIAESLDNALDNKNIQAVIIKANSPGGSPVYSDMLYNKILELRKKYPHKNIDLVTEEVCASGCYYIATAANNIYANKASIIGSIGVIYMGFGVTKLMDKLGIESRVLIAGKNKAVGLPFRESNKEQTRMQQEVLNKVHLQFIDAVKFGRGSRLKANDDIFSGRYWLGVDAIKLGLIDGFSTVDQLALDKYKTTDIVDFTIKEDALTRLSKTLSMHLSSFTKQLIYDNGIYK